jgi:hypothetical protein
MMAKQAKGRKERLTPNTSSNAPWPICFDHSLQASVEAIDASCCSLFDFGVAEELAHFRVQEDGVVRDAVVFEHLFQLRPDRVVAFFVFMFGAGVDRHDESFADFHGALILEDNRSQLRERMDGVMR